jgi:hypothetical protein
MSFADVSQIVHELINLTQLVTMACLFGQDQAVVIDDDISQIASADWI